MGLWLWNVGKLSFSGFAKELYFYLNQRLLYATCQSDLLIFLFSPLSIVKGSTLMFLTTWLGTFQYWKQALPFGIPLGLMLEFLLHVSALSSVPMVVVNIYQSYKNKTGKMRTFVEAARPFFPFLTYLALFMFWIYKSPRHIMETDTRAVFLLTGTIFSNMSVSISCVWDMMRWDMMRFYSEKERRREIDEISFIHTLYLKVVFFFHLILQDTENSSFSPPIFIYRVD